MSLFIFTGPPGSGKNTTAEAVVKVSEKLAVIDVDIVRWMIRQPHKAPWEGENGAKQQMLGVYNSCTLAKSFILEGYDVLILDVLTTKTAEVYREKLKQYNPKIILLLPSYEEVIKRNNSRPARLKDKEIKMLYEEQKSFTAFDEKINNSDLSVDEVLKKLSLTLRE